MGTPMATADPDTRRKILRRLTYGLQVVTASADGDLAGGTITWISQASFSPPLVMVGIKASSRLHAAVELAGAFAVNLLAEDQKDVAQAFFRPGEREEGLLNGYEFEQGPETGAPLLVESPMWFEARVTDTVKRGDHTVFIAEIVSVGVRADDVRALALRDTTWSYGG